LAHRYKFLYKPEHPNSNSEGQILEHRYIMSEFLGRPLTKDEHIHHKNGDRRDNRIENLQLMSRSEHAIMTNIGNQNGRKHNGNTICILCDTKETKRNKVNNELWYPYEDGYICYPCKHPNKININRRYEIKNTKLVREIVRYIFENKLKPIID
jgi:hypothetical protein